MFPYDIVSQKKMRRYCSSKNCQRGYGDGAPRGDNEATAFAAMLVHVKMSA